MLSTFGKHRNLVILLLVLGAGSLGLILSGAIERPGRAALEQNRPLQTAAADPLNKLASKVDASVEDDPQTGLNVIEAIKDPAQPSTQDAKILSISNAKMPAVDVLPSVAIKPETGVEIRAAASIQNNDLNQSANLPEIKGLLPQQVSDDEPKLETTLEIAALDRAQVKVDEPSQLHRDQTTVPNQDQPAQPVASAEGIAPKPAPEPSAQIKTEVAAVELPELSTQPAAKIDDRYEFKPSFDLVRVEPDGSALIAGTAPAGAIVTIFSDGIELGQTKASSRGEFVAFVSTMPEKDVQSLELRAATSEGPVVVSDDRVLLLAKTETAGLTVPEAGEGPTVVKATPDGLTIVQAPDFAALDHVTLDTIGYDDAGEVVLTGRGVPGQRVFVYADDKPVGANRISESGTWRMVMVGLNAGRYVLRVDEVDPDGEVTSRVESPFQRVFPEDELLQAGLTRKNVIVQPGSNLWTIARIRYGNGNKYTQIFQANRDRIRNPDLIYPGQIFNLPEDGGPRAGPVKRKRRG